MILLGRTVTVTGSTNPDAVGITGLVIADGRDTITVRTPRGERLLVKHTITIRTDGFIIEGKSLVGTHAHRARK